MAEAERPLAELARRALIIVDKRSLGLARIVLALVLIGDLGRRALSAGLWYAEDGPLPSAVYRESPSVLASALLASPGAWSVVISFALALSFDAALLVGYRTRIAGLLALAALVNLESRVPTLQNGGDRMLSILCFWTLFLPMGDRFSLDARRRPVSRIEIQSLAYLALLLQLAIAYFLNSIQKTASSWNDGTALSYLLRDPTLTSRVGCAASNLPSSMIWVLTRGTRAIEFAAPFLILSPLYSTWARRIAIGLLLPFHLAIALTMNVGVFSWAMIAFYPLLLGKGDWSFIERQTNRFGIRFEKNAGKNEPERREIVWAREATVVAFMLASGHRVLTDNGVLSPSSTPVFVKTMIEVPRLYQLWAMFTANHFEASMVIVDAETEDGRHVDPLNEAASPNLEAKPPWTVMPRCMNRDAFVQNYAFAARTQRGLWGPLRAFVLRYPDRTKRASDRIVRFTLFEAKQTIPAPDDGAEPKLHLEPLFRYPSDVEPLLLPR
jgi:hypothetical protein